MKDSKNHTISLSMFEGGEVWIHDPTARKGEPNVTPQQVGLKTLYGVKHVTRDKLARFNPRSYHCVVPWKGDRWSITAYVNRAVPKLQSNEVSKLLSYGFSISKRAAIPAPVPDPEDDRVLEDLVTRDSAPRPSEPRTKPKVKIRASDKKKDKKKNEKPEEPKPSSKEFADDFDKILEDLDIENTKKGQTPQLGDMEHLSQMIDEFASDIEPDEPPKPDPGRPPGGECKVPDGEGSSDPKVLKEKRS